MERHRSEWRGSRDCLLVNANADIPTGRSAWSRGPTPGGERRIGDLTDSEAMKYLTAGRKFPPDLASEIIAFCGTRIQLLKGASNQLDHGMTLEGLSTPIAVACALL